jgi:hypothetical protein
MAKNLVEFSKEVEELRAMVLELKEELAKGHRSSVRDRGPNSTRDMTEDDAKKVMLGDLKDVSHRKAAEELGLSYGQIYSARNGYTFKGVYKMMQDATKAAPAEDVKISK